jgi:fructokinase
VGRDAWGQKIRSSIAASGISLRYLADLDYPTGTAQVFESDGGAGFEIQANVAWDFIQLEPSALELADQCEAVVFGSLGQRSQVSCASIQRFVARVKGQRLYDVNLRRNTRSGEAGYNESIIRESLRLATLVKMNESELNEVLELLGASTHAAEPLQCLEWLANEFSLDAVAVTRGAKGAWLFTEGRHLALPDSTFDQALVHPVGAGDAFAAGLLFGVMEDWAPEQSVELANMLSSFVVLQVSATPLLPEEVVCQVRALADAAHRNATRRAS